MVPDRRPPINLAKETKVYISEEDNDDQSFVAAAPCSSKILDEKSGKVESDLLSDFKCETLDIDEFLSIYDFDIDFQKFIEETGITLDKN